MKRTEQSFDPSNPDSVDMGSLLMLYTRDGAPLLKGVYSKYVKTEKGCDLFFITEDGEESVDSEDIDEYQVLLAWQADKPAH